MNTENQIAHEQTPIAYFVNKKGVRFATYFPEQVETAKKAGYQQVETDTESAEPIAQSKTQEKLG